MLSFFKSNNPAVVAMYLVYLVVFRLCFVFIPADYSFVFTHTEPLSHLFFSMLKGPLVNNVWLSTSLAGILTFIQALLINDIVNDNKIVARKNYMAGMLFIVVSSFFKECLVLSPALLSLTFVILSTRRMFSLIKKEKAFGDVFDVGFLVAIAAFFYFPAILFILFAYIGLGTVRAFAYRDWIILLLGILSPFVMLFTWYFWFDKMALLLPELANTHDHTWLNGLKMAPENSMLLGALAVLTIAALALLPSALYSSLIQVRKFATALITLLFLIVLAVTLQQTSHLSHWVLLSLPLSIIFSMVLMQIKSKWVSEVMHLILILLVLAGQYLPVLNIF